ncbi:hypothetical protein like AT2G24290 [Hibiscus trionum]|uniref:Uncharacterized protein n=1 Tax=Hibiscus trionum TaxID=183268 RepID=A0A9W7LYW7_HIBTR|nr:hypothetical protein like AT2G24290 [Hibiscus trionum]
MSRRSGTCLSSCLIMFAVISALGVCGPVLYWRFKKSLRSADSKLSCPPCICNCPPPPLSLVNISPWLANLSDTDCGSNDPDLKQEMEKQFVDLLTEELKLQEAVAEEHDRHMNITFGEAKRAKALLIKERKVTRTWEHRAREMGWEGE